MDRSPEQIAALAEQIAASAKQLSTQTDPTAKQFQGQALALQAKSLINMVQDPFFAVMDHTNNFFVIGATRSLMEIGVFEAIPIEGTRSAKQLAAHCDADEALLIRLMRQLTAVGMFKETSPSEYEHTRQTLFLSNHTGMSGKYFFELCVDEMMPAIGKFNEYTRRFGKHDVLNYTETPHSWVHEKLGMNFWEVLMSEPGRMEKVGRGLALFDPLHPVLGIYPFEEQLQASNDANRPCVVDIGGGRGTAMLEIKKGCPSLKGGFYLQDQRGQLDTVSENDLPGVEKMEHDFFTEQPVKNAQVYYIKRVFHDWLNPEAKQILQSIVPAMGKDSRILISDMVMPEPVQAQDTLAVWLDLMM